MFLFEVYLFLFIYLFFSAQGTQFQRAEKLFIFIITIIVGEAEITQRA